VANLLVVYQTCNQNRVFAGDSLFEGHQIESLRSIGTLEVGRVWALPEKMS